MQIRSLNFFVGAIELCARKCQVEEMIPGVLRDVYPWPSVIS